jgi:hypothetical protein
MRRRRFGTATFRVSASKYFSDSASLDSFSTIGLGLRGHFVFVPPMDIPFVTHLRHFRTARRVLLEAWHIEYNNAALAALAQEP